MSGWMLHRGRSLYRANRWIRHAMLSRAKQGPFGESGGHEQRWGRNAIVRRRETGGGRVAARPEEGPWVERAVSLSRHGPSAGRAAVVRRSELGRQHVGHDSVGDSDGGGRGSTGGGASGTMAGRPSGASNERRRESADPGCNIDGGGALVLIRSTCDAAIRPDSDREVVRGKLIAIASPNSLSPNAPSDSCTWE